MLYEFEWDSGNLTKMEKVSASGRHFSISEIESVFQDLLVITQTTYSDPISDEDRYITFGMSNQSRVVSVVFVVRTGRISVFNVWKTKGSKLKEYHGQKAK